MERVMPTPQRQSDDILIDRYFQEILNRGDFSRADEILSADFVFCGPTTPHGVDRAGLRLFVEETRAAFSNKHFKELERISEGPRTALRFRMTGTQDGSLHGVPPFGAEIDIEGCDLIYIQNNRIVRVRAYLDLMAIVQKLLVPPPLRLVEQFFKSLQRAQK
jgi:predicted ester cyclase